MLSFSTDTIRYSSTRRSRTWLSGDTSTRPLHTFPSLDDNGRSRYCRTTASTLEAQIVYRSPSRKVIRSFATLCSRVCKMTTAGKWTSSLKVNRTASLQLAACERSFDRVQGETARRSQCRHRDEAEAGSDPRFYASSTFSFLLPRVSSFLCCPSHSLGSRAWTT